ncbi:MAG TPA: PEGA domain-containing protein [Acidobacteriota bacterium]|nr:PEGA domain-containing protein [Acidobacteriota bacterium]
MRLSDRREITPFVLLMLTAFITIPCPAKAGNDVLGELRLISTAKMDRLAGVWIDGVYVGYVGELKGSKKVLLLPGEHELTVRYSGYQDFSRKILAEPGKKLDIAIHLDKGASIQNSSETSEIKLVVKPDRAAVFLNGGYVGHVNEFNGPGQWMIVPSGSYSLKITLPGYLPFETTISLRPRQKFEVKTDLFPGSIKESGPLVDQQPTRLSSAAKVPN